MDNNSIAAAPLDITKVKMVYRGAPNRCMCGCSGDYWTDATMIKRIVNKINKLGPRTYKGCKKKFTFADTKTRNYTAYFDKD